MKYYLYLLAAIIFEVIGTTMLKLSQGFNHLMPTIGVIIGFGLSFTLIIFALKAIPLSLAYSIWAGLGTAGTGVVGVMVFNEALSGLNIVGLIIIIIGVVIMNLSSGTTEERAESSHI